MDSETCSARAPTIRSQLRPGALLVQRRHDRSRQDQKDQPGAPPVVVNAIANEDQPPKERGVGPTITGIIDLRDSAEKKVVIEEMAVPGPLRRLFEEVVTTGHTLRELARADRDDHVADGPPQDPCAVRRSAIQSSSILAIMGNEEAGGALSSWAAATRRMATRFASAGRMRASSGLGDESC